MMHDFIKKNMIQSTNSFLPFLSTLQLHLGSLLQCTGPNSNSITSLRHTVPPTKALYMHTLRADARSPLGQVISIGILPHTSHIVTLGTTDRKVSQEHQVDGLADQIHG